MNNQLLYDTEDAGGIPYQQTEKYEYLDYFCTEGLTDTAAYKTIRFTMRQENLLIHWRNAYLEIGGMLCKEDGTGYAQDAKIALIHNAIPHMFKNGKLSIGNSIVENINELGYVSSLMHYVLLARSKSDCDGLDFMWAADKSVTNDETNSGFKKRQNYVIKSPASHGTFKLRIPLHLLFGFFENFVALRGYPVTMELVRASDSCCIVRSNPAVKGKLKINRMVLNAPIVDPSTVMTLHALKGLKDPKPYLFSFRRRSGMMVPISPKQHSFSIVLSTSSMVERPQVVFFGFQKDMDETQLKNPALFWHSNLETSTISVNNVSFPANPIPANWAENDYGFYYLMQMHARENYLQHPSTFSEGNMINPGNMKSLYPIFVIDISKQDFTIGAKTVTTKLNLRFKEETDDNLILHIAYYSERTLELFTNGERLNIKEHTDSYTS